MLNNECSHSYNNVTQMQLFYGYFPSLRVLAGLSKICKETFEIAEVAYFTGWMPFVVLTQQFQSKL